ncbi:hypothetical protein [Bradyrhizobium japonicum]|uniref:hypothetical protein n=1 Tax=Bradyrhizobium japonicum TaxID=375 RepID=UPI001BA545B6|nr:hypothetical protein [Bradyrhizobium japonicum]MBR0913121.1 hypothetical protein [Bradyrhizobium japonicum]
MPNTITPSLGANLNKVDGLKPYYDGNNANPSPKLGTVVKADDGHDYILAQASAAIASAATGTLTEGTWQMSATPGPWTAPTVTGGVASGGYAWFKRTAI